MRAKRLSGQRTTGAGPAPNRLGGSSPSRAVVFGAVLTACVVVAVGYVVWAALRSQGAAAGTPSSAVTLAAGGPERIAAVQSQPFVLLQHVARDQNYARLALVPVATPDGPRTMSTLTCERAHFAAGRGLCLAPEGGLLGGYRAHLFGPDIKPTRDVVLAGSPSRARVSPDGRYGAATVFVYGHSYADANFSTQTTIIDMSTGEVIGELEQFIVFRDGTRFHSPDFNFWGVTFTRDSNRFYATLRTGGQIFLVEGDVTGRAMNVIAKDVECPSISPDNTRLAYKKRLTTQNAEWRLHVVDLQTMRDTAVAEDRNVDDQVEWLNDREIVYGIAEGASADLWAVAADGTGKPRKLISDALSPAVVR